MLQQLGSLLFSARWRMMFKIEIVLHVVSFDYNDHSTSQEVVKLCKHFMLKIQSALIIKYIKKTGCCSMYRVGQKSCYPFV